MAFRGIVGNIEDEYEKVHLYWRIENFFSLGDHRYHSPSFDCYGESFYLQIYPNGEKGNKGWISLYLVLRERCPALEIQFQFAIKTADGVLENNMSFENKFGRKGGGCGSARFLDKSLLWSRKDEWAPCNDLTIEVTLESGPPHMEEIASNVSVEEQFENSACGETNDVLEKAGYEGDGLPPLIDLEDKSTKKEEEQVKKVASNVFVQEQFDNSACGETNNVSLEKADSEKVTQDLTKIWQSGDYSDVVVRVKDVEYKAHRVILAARSPVLSAMFQHDTTESRSGEIKISDCDPDVFQEFMHYIYSGGPQKLTSLNAAPLYAVAAKYLTDDLKDRCLRYIRSNLSVDNFCQAVTLALKHGESELLQHAKDFVSENIRQIVKSAEWQRFLQDEPTTANEILIKALGS